MHSRRSSEALRSAGVSSGDFGGTPTNAEGTAANGGVDHAVDAVLPDDDGGCSVSSRRGSAGGGGLLSLIAVALAAMGWRRRERS
jgi:MYXO-CTERM domain-containing protein